MSIQEALKLLRIELGFTQEDLAEKLNKAFITVNRWENGKAFPSRTNSLDIVELATKCGASPNCINYLNEVLLPDCKRTRSGSEYGFPDIDIDFLYQLTDNATDSLYVIDAETYELKYTNRTAEITACRDLNEMGIPTDERKILLLEDKRCFHFFGNRKEPCAFCPLKEMNSDNFINKVIQVPEVGRMYNIRAKSTKLNGRKVYVVYQTEVSELFEECKSLYQMTNDIPVGVGIYNIYLDDRIELIFMNDVYYQMIGEIRKEQLMKFGATKFCLVDPDDRERMFDEIKRSIAQKRNIEIDLNMKIKDGNYYKVHVSARMVRRDYEKFTYYCTFKEL